MSPIKNTLFPLPPRLTMDEYVDFISETLASHNRELAMLQKNLEERITTPFSIPRSLPDALA